jgi:hypothetical protein
VKVGTAGASRVSADAENTLEFIRFRYGIACLHAQDAHMTIDGVIVIAVVDAYIETFTGLMVGWGTPTRVGSVARRCSAHQFVIQVIVDAIVTAIATGSPDST